MQSSYRFNQEASLRTVRCVPITRSGRRRIHPLPRCSSSNLSPFVVQNDRSALSSFIDSINTVSICGAVEFGPRLRAVQRTEGAKGAHQEAPECAAGQDRAAGAAPHRLPVGGARPRKGAGSGHRWHRGGRRPHPSRYVFFLLLFDGGGKPFEVTIQ